MPTHQPVLTIAVHATSQCPACGDGHQLDHKATGRKAATWRTAANVSQRNLASKGMGIKQSFYSSLERGERRWTVALIQKFEQSIRPLLDAASVKVEVL